MKQRIRNILLEATEFEDRPNINDAFWKWFGDSVATDEQGNPLVMYRGSYHDEGDTFGANADFIYLTPMLSYAKNFLYRGLAKNIGQFYVKMENPLDMRKFGDGRNRRWELYTFLKEHGVDVSDMIQQYGYNSETGRYPLPEKECKKRLMGKDTFVWELFFRDEENHNMKKRIRDAGYDGLIWNEKLTNDNSGKDRYGLAYVVSDPRQIKSIHNQGTWNPNSPDVTK